ncbi:MAG: hypothetical protein QOF04_112, partial [Solirubrobacteraceae bacterium]|nr:hypothetical protein [Solirubrobacteraceae bacterium]
MPCAIATAGDTTAGSTLRVTRRRVTGWDLGVLVAANAAVVTGLWWRQGGLGEVHDLAGLLTSLGRLTGLLGAFLALVQLLLLARVPVLTALGGERVAAWHRRNGTACLALLVAHTALVTAGYARTDGVALPREVGSLLADYEGVLLATVGLGLLVLVVVTSVVAVRRRLGHRAWRAVHVTAYAAIALAFAHQLATGHEFQRQPVARAYWWALYAAVVAAIVGVRVVLPVVRSLRHRLRVERVVHDAPGVVSLEIGGERLDRFGARSGQFAHWRFLAPGHWWQSHALSLSAAPDGRLRITVRHRGGHAARLADVRPGTRVIADGPYGSFTGAARRRPRVALIASGAGIAPVRALLATAVEEGLIRSNPAAGIRLAVPVELDEEERAKALTEEQLRAFLDELPGEWRLFFEFLAHTGLRIGEAVAVSWEHVDFGERRVRLYRGSYAPPKSR